MWKRSGAEPKGQEEEVLFRGMPLRLEEQASETGELEEGGHLHLPGMRQGVPVTAFRGCEEKVLQPRLRESRTGNEDCGEERSG